MKKYLGIFASITMILLLSGCGKPTTIIENTNTKKNTEINLDECKKGCDLLVNKAMTKDNCYNLCETSKKLESNDISDCDDIENTSNSFVTKDICIQDKAIQTKNPEFCEKIENEINKDTCYIALAEDLQDKSLCKKITNEIIKTTCMQEEIAE